LTKREISNHIMIIDSLNRDLIKITNLESI